MLTPASLLWVLVCVAACGSNVVVGPTRSTTAVPGSPTGATSSPTKCRRCNAEPITQRDPDRAFPPGSFLRTSSVAARL